MILFPLFPTLSLSHRLYDTTLSKSFSNNLGNLFRDHGDEELARHVRSIQILLDPLRYLCGLL